MYCHHRHLRGLAGSRACFPRPKNAHSARAISFFLYLFHGKCFAQSDIESADIFLCNHKHIQSFVNSVLIIAKTLSLSPSLARAFIIEASAKERERERKKEKKRYNNIIIIFFLRGKKGVQGEKKKGRKKT
jgi:hypothetical protein